MRGTGTLRGHHAGADRVIRCTRCAENFALLRALFTAQDGVTLAGLMVGHRHVIHLDSVATRLSDGARLNDTVARVGGDEFMLICPDLHSQKNADIFCQRLVDSLKQPISTDFGQIQIGASIGVAFYPDPANSVEALIKMADAAMYATKNKGKTCPFFIPG